eukprot:6478361-Amphidinium_carterae.1
MGVVDSATSQEQLATEQILPELTLGTCRSRREEACFHLQKQQGMKPVSGVRRQTALIEEAVETPQQKMPAAPTPKRPPTLRGTVAQ